MKKITFLNNFFHGIYGNNVVVRATDCGQNYFVKENDIIVKAIWVDSLKNNKISIKVKFIGNEKGLERARYMAKKMIETFEKMEGIVVNENIKCDVYAGRTYGRNLVWVARLVCDKVWY